MNSPVLWYCICEHREEERIKHEEMKLADTRLKENMMW